MCCRALLISHLPGSQLKSPTPATSHQSPKGPLAITLRRLGEIYDVETASRPLRNYYAGCGYLAVVAEPRQGKSVKKSQEHQGIRSVVFLTRRAPGSGVEPAYSSRLVIGTPHCSLAVSSSPKISRWIGRRRACSRSIRSGNLERMRS